ncbi:hypothetical protein ONE63_002387 [Megalurothrips usitatus]|uniref:Uncharacterized protein n=1 Tax=Megalurothrips usitatus TaxID=439358 RepID=A0AAV7XBR8_9NEOP|nr:hypothetical protein ONE63_002387 [Megalurothrips usitatus]
MPAQRLIVDRHLLKILNMESAGGIPSNNSHQQLMSAADDNDSGLESTAASSLVSVRVDSGMKAPPICGGVTASQWVTMAILCFVNLINYMDRYTIAGECVGVAGGGAGWGGLGRGVAGWVDIVSA